MRYLRPEVIKIDDRFENVFAASGDSDLASDNKDEKKRCRFGRVEANSGSDTCQVCSVSGGARNNALPGESLFESDFKGCPDNMPIKNK